ncbi:hypothetical protein PR003_g13236 [Phytophthora rubi]|uniref:Peptidase A2 domain-containing protein n=2 Tax=Phytophthora rubi TaxID=129364 RepID=A0A6A4F9L9_9STRA|nr:hypothetical protein PR003_g13236 [Phytophthora rubi]
MEKPSESATGELTTGSDEETTRTTTVNVCNGARCRCLEALPVVVKHVNNLPSKKAEVNSSVVPVKKRTDSEESDSPVTKTSVPGSSKPEYVQDEAGNAQLASVPEEPSVESEDDWFKKTLAASAEVKRANRDFRADSPPTKEGNRPDPGPSGPTEPENANDEDASIMNEVVASIVPSSRFAATTVDERRVIANIDVSRANLERKDEDVPSALPFRLRTLCHYPEAHPPEAEPRGHFVPGAFSAEHMTRARELVIEIAGVLGDSVMQSVLREISRTYLESVSSTLAKRLARRKTCWCDRPVRDPLRPRRVRFDCSSLTAGRSEALGSHTGCVEDPDDVLNYVCFVKDGSAKKEKRKPDLREVENRPKPEVSPNVDVEDFVPEGKRVICSVEGFEATSVGFIDSLPAELLIDTGAIGSLVDSRVLASSAWRRPHCDRTMAV